MPAGVWDDVREREAGLTEGVGRSGVRGVCLKNVTAGTLIFHLRTVTIACGGKGLKESRSASKIVSYGKKHGRGPSSYCNSLVQVCRSLRMGIHAHVQQ